MLVKGATKEKLKSCAAAIGVEVTDLDDRGVWTKFRLSPGGEPCYRRISNTGRRVNAVCWHGHRDFLLWLFELCPDATLKTSLATYRGKEDFLKKFESTGWNNCGSMAMPLTYRHACKCEEG